MTSKTTIFALLMLAFTTSMASSSTEEELIKQIEFALYEEDYFLVMQLSKKLEAINPQATEHKYYLNLAKHLSISRGEDLSKILAYESTYGKTDKYFNYWLGRIHMLRYELDKAEERLNAFLETETFKSKQIIQESKYFLEWIEKARPYHENPSNYEVEPLPKSVNSPYIEVSPAFYGDHNELVFVSNRPTASASAPNQFKVFHSFKKGEDWSAPSELKVFGSFDFEHSKIEVLDKQKRLFVFKPNNGGDLFYSELVGDHWSFPLQFNTEIKNKHIESHFFISDNEDLILFISGSSKNQDIWESRLVNGNWTDPAPIKGLVNSEFNEESPFLSHAGDQLYFSSNRPESMGGYDVYRATYNKQTQSWGKAENMGFPINTMDDDINFELTPSDQSGFLTSNRLHTQGDYDIFYFHKEAKIKIVGIVTDRNTGNMLEGVQVKFHPKKYTDEYFEAKTSITGRYETAIFNKETFKVEALIDGQVIYETEYQSHIPAHDPHLTLNLAIDRSRYLVKNKDYSHLYKGEYESSNVSLDLIGNKFRKGNKSVLNHIYFDYTSYDLSDESQPILTKLHQTLIKYPDLRIEISGHTDSSGDHDSNMLLSEKRAQAVKNYLIINGIDANRLTTKGYGETQPIASNDDEQDGRALNRRIEVKVLE